MRMLACALFLAAVAPLARAEAPEPYVLVTDESLAAAFVPLANVHTAGGLVAGIHTMQEIRAAYPVARDDAERVRNFLKDMRATRGTRFVLLGGDDPLVPIRRAFLRTGYLGDILLPTDQYYACLDGTWNADGDSLWGELPQVGEPGDSVDFVSELAVGRAPVTTPAEAQRFVAKCLDALAAPNGSIAVLMAAANRTIDYATSTQQLLPSFATRPDTHVERLYANSPAWPGSDPLTRAALLDSLQRGYDLVVMAGPGGPGVFEAEPFPAPYAAAPDFAALANPHRSFAWVLSAYTTQPGASVGRAWVTDANGGAFAVIGTTDLQFAITGTTIMSEFFRQAIELHVPTAGEALAAAIQIYPPGTDAIRLATQGTLLFGDPAIPVPGSMEAPVPVRLSLVDAETSEGVARLTWFGAEGGIVERRTEASDWIVLGPARAQGDGLLAYEDRVAPGRYAYRLRAPGDVSEETWLTVPGAAALALAGFRPNPGRSIAFTLASSAPATLDVVDVAGRRVASQEVGSLGAGDHVFDPGASLRAGIYWIRLNSGGKTLVARGVVTR